MFWFPGGRGRGFGRLLDEILDLVFEGPGCVVVLLVFLVFVAFLGALSRALSRVDPENRRMDPGAVWLNLLPVFNLVWMPVTIDRVAWSIREEFRMRGRLDLRDSYGRSAGLTALSLAWIGTVLLPLGVLVLALALVYALVYWAQISMYGGRLGREQSAPRQHADEGW